MMGLLLSCLKSLPRGLRLFFVFLSFFLFSPQLSQAQEPAYLFEAKLFEPALSPHAVLGVYTSQNMGHLTFYGHLVANYAQSLLISVSDWRGQKQQIVSQVIGSRATTDVAIGLGLGSFLDIGLMLPVILYQQGEGFLGADDSYEKGGFGDLRFFAKLTLLRSAKEGGVGLALSLQGGTPLGVQFYQTVQNASVSDGAFLESHGFHFTPGLILDYRTQSGFVLSLNVRFRFFLEDKPSIAGFKSGNELRVGVGTEIPLFLGTSLALEVMSSTYLNGLDGQRDGWSHFAVEGLAAFRWRLGPMTLNVGGGRGLWGGPSAPDLRLFVGLSFAFGRAAQRSKPISQIPPKWVYPHDPKAAMDRAKPPPRRRPLPKVEIPKFEAKRTIPEDQFDAASKADPDPDGDGISNDKDKCPNETEDKDNFEDEDGCPDLDNDRDGIPDTKDKCPLKAEVVNGVDDYDGCPDKGKGRIVFAGDKINIKDKVFFASGSDRLEEVSFQILDQVASFMRAQWQLQLVRVEGHTDSRGNAEFNIDLSERRARRVMSYLIQKGVAFTRLKAKGYGPKSPIASNKTKEGRVKNRRVEFTILKVFRPKSQQAPESRRAVPPRSKRKAKKTRRKKAPPAKRSQNAPAKRRSAPKAKEKPSSRKTPKPKKRKATPKEPSSSKKSSRKGVAPNTDKKSQERKPPPRRESTKGRSKPPETRKESDSKASRNSEDPKKSETSKDSKKPSETNEDRATKTKHDGKAKEEPKKRSSRQRATFRVARARDSRTGAQRRPSHAEGGSQ